MIWITGVFYFGITLSVVLCNVYMAVARPPPMETALNSTSEERMTNSSKSRGFVSFSEYSQRDIVFPDSEESSFEPVPRLDGPPKCAKSDSFCEDFEAYPKDYLKEVLKHNNRYKELWGKDEAPIDISNRVGGGFDNFICGSLERLIFPKMAKSKNKKWKYIINQEDEGYVQGVRIETCRNEGGPCDIIGSLPDGITTTCKQKYMYRRLIALGNSGMPAIDSFQLPSACCCAYKRNFDFLARFGAPVTPAKVNR